VILCALILSALQQADADVLWAAGERVAAIEAMLRELERRPDDAELRAVLVRREVGVHRYAAALEHARPLGESARAERGYCLFRLGRFEEALELLDPALPDQALCVFDTLELLGRQAEARAVLPAVARARGADDPEVLVRRGRIAAADGELAAAEALFRRALDGDPVQAAAWFGLGQALVRGDRREEALAALRRHRELVPLLDALEFAQKSLDLAPNHAPNHANVGDAERALGRIDRAESSYRRAAVLAADDEVTPIALRHARLLAEDERDVDGAVLVLGAAFRRVPDVRLLVRQGDVLLAAHRAGAACDAFAQAAALRPDDAEIARRLATARAAAESGK
jgi:tetratricopeptide (TPR) repeat protein